MTTIVPQCAKRFEMQNWDSLCYALRNATPKRTGFNFYYICVRGYIIYIYTVIIYGDHVAHESHMRSSVIMVKCKLKEEMSLVRYIKKSLTMQYVRHVWKKND